LWTNMSLTGFEAWSHSVYAKNSFLGHVGMCSMTEVHRRFGGIYCFYLQGRRVSHVRTVLLTVLPSRKVLCLTQSTILDIEPAYSSEMSVRIYGITSHEIVLCALL
jgi:hypothetical protein